MFLSVRILSAWALATAFWLGPTTALASDDLHLAVSSNIRGAVASLACSREAPRPLLHTLDASFHEATGAHALVLDAGHFLGASFLASEALRRSPPLLADLVQHLGIRAMALEHRDLMVDRDLLIAFAKTLAARSIPMVLTNLACEPEAQALCDAVFDTRSAGATFETPSGIVAFLALVDPSIFDALPATARAGLRLEDPVKAMASAVRQARAAGAEHVVVAYEPNPAADLETTFRFLQAIDEEDSPDLLLVDRLADHLARLDRPHSKLRVVATRPGGMVHVDGDHVRIASPSDAPVDPFLRTWSADFDVSLCGDLGTLLAGGELPRPLGRREFRELAADILRRDLRADVAIVSRESYGSGMGWPLEGQLTLLDLYAALPFNDQVGTVSLDGASLRKIFERITPVGFVTRGFDAARGTVNGRAIVDTQRYTVATTRLYFDHAAGASELSREGATGFDGPTLRDLVLGEVREPSPLDPRDRMGKPEELTSWAFRSILRFALSTTQISNDDRTRLTDGPLVRSDALALTGDLEVRIDGDNPRWQFLNGSRLRYGLSSSGGDLAKNRDLIDDRSVLVWKQTRGNSTPVGVPNLFAELFVETETAPPPTRSYHHLLFRPSGGVRFELSPVTSLQFGIGADWEALASRAQLLAGGSAPLLPAVIATLIMRPTPVLNVGSRAALGEFTLDLSRRNPLATSLAEPASVELRARAKLTLPLSRFIAITTTYDLFGRRSWAPDAGHVDGGWVVSGLAQDLIVGLDLVWSGQRPSYRP